ncbi:hypothetical protein PIB30_070050 [Stylosanthes scabra]|uniref:Transposase (putative) gypsy type domain-containing protein n=1 Tax=Stylosanthes scabra TaxID=79078 RepID=A0ABU6WLR8_9FABA|nr:hypothetical protein [Stylosanthes scabra]
MEGGRLTDENGKPVVPIESGDPYSWVKGEVREQASLFQDEESVAELGDLAGYVGLEFMPCCSEDRVFHKTSGWEYFYMYTTVFIDIDIRFPFTQFENGVLSQLKCAPTQIHPNAWAFIRGFEVLMEFLGQEPLLEVFFSFFRAKGVRKGGLLTLNSVQGRALFVLYRSSYKDFKQMYVKVRSPEKDFSFYIDECLLERFPLHWYSESVQILGMVEPLEKKKPISMKRRRAEGEASGKSRVIDLTNSKCCGKDVSLEEVKSFTRNQRKLHGYVGEEDLTSVWSEHFPFSVLAEEHFQSKTDLDLIGSVDDLTRAQYMQVCAARLLCVGRFEELKAKREAEQKREESAEVERSMAREKKLQLAMEQIAEREKELLGLKNENADLNGKLQILEKNKAELEARVVELCGQKKAAEFSKEEHGYDMLLAGFERAKKQAEFLFIDVSFDKLDPIKVVHDGALVDDDEVDVEGGGDHDPEA